VSPCIVPEHHQRDKDGYQKAKYNKRLQGVHRIVWQLCFGSIPAGMVIGHKCNNPSCVNPEHLYLTTAAQNSSDAKRDGLYKKGNDHPHCKWRDEQIQSMLNRYDSGETQKSIAADYNVTQARISYCISRARKTQSKV
jgi:hypothetical protein